MSATQCDVHGLPWRNVPAGISKSTGKPYQGFRACPERGCQEKPPRTEAAPAAQANPAVLEELKLQTKLLTDISESLSALVINRKVGTMTNHTAPVSFAPPKQPVQSNDEINVEDIPF